MIDAYEFANTNCVLMQPDGSVHPITDIGTAIRLLENIKQTGVKTTHDGKASPSNDTTYSLTLYLAQQLINQSTSENLVTVTQRNVIANSGSHVVLL